MTTKNHTASTRDVIFELAKGVYAVKTPTAYSRIRTKLNKQGFSEIALYSAVARHCEENSIKPSAYIADLIKLLDGCGRDIFFPKTHNSYNYLRGQYHDLRHGNLDKGEPKSPEQRGLFLCNSCHQVLDKDARSTSNTDKNTCKKCKAEKSKEYYEKQKQAQSVDATPPPTQETPPMSNKPENKRFAHLVGGQVEQESQIKITEVMADEKGATVTVTCPTADLHLALSALSQIAQN